MSSISPIDEEIRIRVFRATDDPESCLKFIEGHRRVLSIYGIENITSNTNDWMYRRSMFVIVVEKLDGSKLYGGARIQIADGIHPWERNKLGPWAAWASLGPLGPGAAKTNTEANKKQYSS